MQQQGVPEDSREDDAPPPGAIVGESTHELRCVVQAPVRVSGVDSFRSEGEREVDSGAQTVLLQQRLDDLGGRSRIARRLEHDEHPRAQMFGDRGEAACTYPRSGPESNGVGTQMKTTSTSGTKSPAPRASKRPSAATAAIRSEATSGTWLSPSLRAPQSSSSVSIPRVVKPASAQATARGRPAYPSPTTMTRVRLAVTPASNSLSESSSRGASISLHHSTVRANPSLSETVGSQPKVSRARPMSGTRRGTSSNLSP